MCMAKPGCFCCFLKDKLNLRRLRTEWDKKSSALFEIIPGHLVTLVAIPDKTLVFLKTSSNFRQITTKKKYLPNIYHKV